TYPGKFKSYHTPSKNNLYGIKQKILGKEKFDMATKVVGFHHHYTMPKGVFDYEKKELKKSIDSKLKRSLINSYNFEIAVDPILTLFTQSSPFFNGKYIAKDSRMLIYRGGKKLNYPGVYDKYQQFGGLPPYKQTGTDLIRSLFRRTERWKKLVKENEPNADFDSLYPYKLDISWNPVKLNKHCTLEQRGMDMNLMSIIIGVSILLKFTLRKIHREFIEVIPADRAIVKPFEIKNGILVIPPHTYIRDVLQKASAYEGFENDELYNYAKRFYRFAKSLVPDFYYPLLANIDKMIKKRSSISDKMILYARRNKMIDPKGCISQDNCRKISLHFSKLFEKDLAHTLQILNDIKDKHTNYEFEVNGELNGLNGI
ncbi:MAG: hypothetical protein ACMXX5_00140, partial [Candidatus Woesearchaeota archaeon]